MNNFPFAVLEAQSSGLPVIATRVGGIPEYVINGKNGLLIEPANPEQLAETITALLLDTDSAVKFGKFGRECCEKRLAWPLTEKEVSSTYQRALRNP